MRNPQIPRRGFVLGLGATAALAACAAPAEPGGADATIGPAQTGTNKQYVVAKVSDVPVGTAFAFNSPADGTPAYLMQPTAGTFLAYLAICTHEGCVVEYAADQRTFLCPCHGANYDDQGAVTRGPAKSPLQRLEAFADGDDVVVVAG